MHKHSFMRRGRKFDIYTSDPNFVPPADDGSVEDTPVKIKVPKTSDEDAISALVITSLKVSEVDAWVETNVKSMKDVRDVLKQLVKTSCKSCSSTSVEYAEYGNIRD